MQNKQMPSWLSASEPKILDVVVAVLAVMAVQ